MPYECVSYYGETAKPLTEHRKRVNKVRSNQPKLAACVRKDQHRILCNNYVIIGRETNMVKRKVTEASFIASDVNSPS